MALHTLDASAILALWYAEPIDSTAHECFSNAVISAVNLAEALTVVIRDGHSQADFLSILHEADIEIVPFDESMAQTAATLVNATARYGLSLGDRACLALAMQMGSVAVTADRIWRELDVVDIRMIR